jgi:hypothetical protein
MARPLKAHEAGTQVTIGLRVPAELKTRLEEAAGEQDRSLSQESERRLRRSFIAEELFADALMLLRAEERLHPLPASKFMRAALREICGESIGDLTAWFAQRLALVRMLVGTDTRGKIRRSDLDALKAAVEELERGVDILDEGEEEQVRRMQAADAECVHSPGAKERYRRLQASRRAAGLDADEEDSPSISARRGAPAQSGRGSG